MRFKEDLWFIFSFAFFYYFGFDWFALICSFSFFLSIYINTSFYSLLHFAFQLFLVKILSEELMISYFFALYFPHAGAHHQHAFLSTRE